MTEHRTIERLRRILRILQWLLTGATVGVLALLAYLYVRPSGTMTVTYRINPSGPPATIENFASKEEAQLIGKVRGGETYFQSITVDPMYFSVPTPWNWRSATVRILYDNPDAQPLLRLGAAHAEGQYAFVDLATYDERLENLPEYWESMREGDTILWQKNRRAFQAYEKRRRELESELVAGGKMTKEDEEEIASLLGQYDLTPYAQNPAFGTIGAFLDNLPPARDIVSFNYNLNDQLKLSDYRPRTSRTIVSTGFRGAHTIETYVGPDEDLDFRFTFREINRHADDDAVTVRVRQGSRTILTETHSDDGIHTPSNVVMAPHQYSLHVPKPGEGVYAIELGTTDDTFIIEINAQQSPFYFVGHVYLADHEEYRSIFPGKLFGPTSLVTDGTTVQARTSHEGSLQTVEVNGAPLTLTAPHVFAEKKNLAGVTTVVVPENDVYLAGGSFALTEEQLFSRRLVRPVSLLDLIGSVDGYDFIIASYHGSQREGDHYVASATVEVPALVKQKGRYDFILNTPGLSENHRGLHLYQVSITLEREPVRFSSLFRRLSSFIGGLAP